MTEARTKALTSSEIGQYHNDGYLCPIRVLTDTQVSVLKEAIDEHMSGRIRSKRYELTDPIRVRRVMGEGGRVQFEYEEGEESEPRTFGFLFNLWKSDQRFAEVGMNPILGGMARQLLGADEVLLMEDNAVVKTPHSKAVPWHQDYSYWPIAQPSAVTAWIALDHIGASNGAMQVVPGSHRLGERLPVSFGDAQSFMRDERPGVEEVPQNPEKDGHQIVTYQLRPGECGFHSALIWHGSTPNATPTARSAFILRYLTSGTIWLGAARFPYDDIGCAIGDPVTSAHFPGIVAAF